MRNIESTFRLLKEKNEAALIAFLTAGYPHPKYTYKIVESVIQGGADIIELGIPFSDPIADGPVIQSSSFTALQSGTTPKTVFKIVRKIRLNSEIPIVIMSYYNSMFRMGLETFFSLASNSGINGIIVPDLPLEEADEYRNVAKIFDIDTIFLISPSTSPHRLKKIIDASSGFIYLISVYGVTGVRNKIEDETLNLLRAIIPYTSQRIPLAVGFGISHPQHVNILTKFGANGIIVGSALIKIIQDRQHSIKQSYKEIKKKIISLKSGTKLHQE